MQVTKQPLIIKFVILLNQFKKCIGGAIKYSKTAIDNPKYVAIRQKLKWYSRFFDLGAMILVDKEENSSQSSDNIDHIALLLKVHYKWLKKFVLFLDESYEDKSSNIKYRKDMKALKETIKQIDEELASVYDPFGKICKLFKKHIGSLFPCSSELTLDVFSRLKKVTDSFSPTKNKSFGSNLTEEMRFVTLQSEKSRNIQSELISLWHTFFVNDIFEKDVIEKLEEMKEYTLSHLNVIESSEESSAVKEAAPISPKDLIKIAAKIQLWPIHEYLFQLFVGMFQTQICEN